MRSKLPKRSVRKRPVAASTWRRNNLALCVALTTATTPVTGCTTHQCDQSCLVIGGSASPNCPVTDAGDPRGYTDGGDLVWWQSSAQDEPWLDFPGQRTYVITYPQPFACPPMTSYQITADASHPQDAGWINGGADLAQFSYASATGITVFNPSCATYGLRIVATPSACGDIGDSLLPDSSGE